MAYAGPVFSSGNPTVDQLFGRQFAVNQSETAQQMEGEKNAIARQQIMAQEKLAQAQLAGQQQQQQQQDLFRMQQAADNKALSTRQLDIMQEDVKNRSGATRADLAAEARKAAIIDANSTAINDSQRANALWKINVESALTAAKKALPWGAGNLGGTSALNLDDPKHPARRAIEKAAFDTVRNQLLAEKGGALNSIIPDAETFTFRPVQYDETGKAISSPVPFNMGTPPPPPGAGVGAPPPTVPDPNAQAAQIVAAPTASGLSGLPDLFNTVSNPLGTGAKGLMAQTGMDQRLENSLMGNILKQATTFGSPGATAPVAAPPMIRIPVPGGSLEMPTAVAEELSRQVAAIAPEQRAAAKKSILEDLLKSGRAKIIQPFQAPESSTLGYSSSTLGY